jgi:hypothetical protein
VRFEKILFFEKTLYYNTGVVLVNYEVVGLDPGANPTYDFD